MTENYTVVEFLANQRPGSEDIIQGFTEAGPYSDAPEMSHAFWINDLLFMVPPESIASESEDTIFTWQSLRTESTSKVHRSTSNKIYTIGFTIPSKSGIVNVDYRDTDIENNNTGKRGGLLDLIIQFKNIPFARVENAYIRSELQIPREKNIAMCLHQISVSTEQGTIDSVRVIMVMSLFNYGPYSHDFSFKKDWKAKESFGGLSFEDVNPVNFLGLNYAERVPYTVENKGGWADAFYSSFRNSVFRSTESERVPF
jgi:hypothetical protein